MPRFSGLIRDTENSSNGNCSRISPLPEVFCLPPSRHKFKSDPSAAHNPCNSLRLNGRAKTSFNPNNVPAASVLPPASPAATGIFFSIKISISAQKPACSKNKTAAL